ncbi:low choriolytic enzyme isoform X1 [Aedes aegypti]|uniref:Metalloendopeptidase n=1 Tax=Aedes aegypti TaxID=7159 RepID=A0A6I8U095_AEDAE|nr:low choriolytic enzyme isoform X1 [Aedes aegypti]
MLPKVFLVIVATWLIAVVDSGVILRDENEVEGSEDEIDLSDLGLDLYGEPDVETGKLLENYDPAKDGVNPEELGSYVEGDMLINRPAGRNGMADKSTRWPGGVVPFEINGNFRANEMQMIEDAINQYHKNTCIRFVPHMGERDYISIESSSSGCWSSVGRVGGKQEVNLQMPGCTTKVGTIVHELMHALGFLHEQNRSERDDWVRIQTQNIQRGTENNFAKAKAGTTDGFGVQYDYGSVMHYSAKAFSSNGQDTIVAKRPTNGASMGQREGFSRSDIEKANRMYRCAEGGQTSPPISLPFPIPSFGGGSGGLPGGPNTYPGGPGLGGGYYPNNGVGGYPGYGFGGPQTYPYGYPGPYGYGLDEKK